MTAQAIGGIAGGLLAGRWIVRFGAIRLVPITLVLFGLIDLVIFNYPRWSTAIVPVLVLFVVVGVPGAVRFAATTTVLQSAVENAFLGRVFAVAGVLAAAGMLVGAAVGRVLGDDVGIVNMLTVQGVGYVVAGLLAGVLLRREAEQVVAAEGRVGAIP
jgi:predicted MFS family arabinose efflux permease